MSDTSQLAAALAPAIAEAFQAIASRPVRTHYSIVEAAEALGVSIDTIRGAIDRGVLKSVKVGKEHRINVEQLRKLGGMTSIQYHKSGGCYAQILLPSRRRVMLWLGRPTKAQAGHIKRYLDQLLAAAKLNVDPPPEAYRWATATDPRIKGKLVEWGLLRGTSTAWTVDGWFAHCIKQAVGKADRTLNRYELSRKRLVAAIGDRPLAELNVNHCRRAVDLLLSEFAETHVDKMFLHGRMWLEAAKIERILDANPFQSIKVGRSINKSRQMYVPADLIQKLLPHCPNTEARAVLLLARYAGLRVPHEVLALRWININVDEKRILIPDNTKTGHRILPLFPELTGILQELWDAAPTGAEWVIDRARSSAGTTWRNWIEAAIQSAAVQQWPKLFVNLRASCRTDLRKRFPAHVVNAWLGHSSKVAEKHYELLTSDDWQKATDAHCNDPERTVTGTVKPNEQDRIRTSTELSEYEKSLENQAFLDDEIPPTGV